MVAQIMNILNQSIVSAAGWFTDIITSSGVVDVFLFFIFLILSIRFLVSPVFGDGRGSDRARRTGKDNNNG